MEMASYSVHFIIFIQVTMLVDISNCFDNRTKCQLCDDNNNNNNNVTICSDFNIRNKTKMQCNNRNISSSSSSSSINNSNNSFKYVFNKQPTDNNSTKLYLEFLESFPKIDLKMFPNVTILKIKSNEELIDFNKVKSSVNITVLNLTSNAIITVANLTVFNNLRLLDLSHNLMENMSTIVMPPKVQVLDLSSNKINIENNITLPDNLRSLNLSNNNINSTNVTVTGLLQKLDLRGNKITSVKPFTNLATLEELYLSCNNISSLEDGVFIRLSSLTRLDLSANKLKSLGDRCFAGLNRLQHLDISENTVFYMEPGTFQYMTNLIRLKLSGNVNLGESEKSNKDDVSLLLGTGQRLQTLEASRTNLTRIPSTLTRSVRTLLLAENKISYLECGDLDSYPLLQILNLTQNQIRDIEDDALGRLEFLSNLLLSENLLQSIPRSLPDNLVVLDLKNNKIESLMITDFVGLAKLQTLALRNNKIQTISDGTFAQLASLQVLDLSENPVRVLSSNTFIGPRKLKQLILSSLTNVTPRKEILSFPVPETGQLQLLNLSSSSTLVSQLLDDIAALTMFRQLTILDISYGNITNIRLDLDRYLPRLKMLLLSGNKFNCTESILTLAKLLGKLEDNRQKREEDEDEGYQYLSDREMNASDESARDNTVDSEPLCSFPDNLRGRPIRSLNDDDFFKATTSTMATTTTMAPTSLLPTTTMVSTSMVTSTMVMMSTTTPLPLTTLLSSTRTVHKQQDNKGFTTKPPTRTTTSYALRNTSNDESLINFTLPLAAQNVSNVTTEDTPHRQNETILPASDGTVEMSTLFDYLNTSDDTWRQHYDIASSSNTTATEHNVSANNANDAAYLASKEAVKKTNVSLASHPGMFVFLSILSMILMASVIMMSSHWRQYRYRLEMSRGYMPQQDIEVRSLSSVGGYDLW